MSSLINVIFKGLVGQLELDLFSGIDLIEATLVFTTVKGILIYTEYVVENTHKTSV